jgi:hypothetical protein
VSTHDWLHAVSPVWQLPAQVPAEQTLPALQVTPHPPQFFGSMLVGMQLPLQRDW